MEPAAALRSGGSTKPSPPAAQPQVLPAANTGESGDENGESKAYAAGGVRGWVFALLKKGSAKGTVKVWTKGIVTQATASSVYYRALKRARPNAFRAGLQHGAVAGQGSPQRFWVRSLFGRVFLLSAHASSGVALFGGYYWALRALHLGDHSAAVNWQNPSPLCAVAAGAAGGAIHAAVVQPLLLFQNHELRPHLGKLTRAERAWEDCLEARGFQRQGTLHYRKQRLQRWGKRLCTRLPSAAGRDAVCFGAFFGTFAVVKTGFGPWLFTSSEDQRDARLVTEATICGGVAGLGGHMVHGLLERSPLRQPERRRSAVPPLRVLISGAPKAALAAAAGFGAAEAILLMAEHWVAGDDLGKQMSLTDALGAVDTALGRGGAG